MKTRIFTLFIFTLVLSVLVQAQDLVLPKGMKQLTPDGVEVSSIMGLNNPMSPQQEEVKYVDKIYFAGKTTEHGRELWVSGKTKETTQMLIDIVPGEESSNPSSLMWLNGKLIFTAETPEHGRELWVSDGTPEGTKMIMDIYPGSKGSNPGSFVFLGDKVLFTAMDEESEMVPIVDPEKPESWIWVTDGTTEGTQRIADLPKESYFEVVGDKAYFIGLQIETWDALWITDGTREGTKMLKNINNRPVTDGTFQTAQAAIGALRNVNDKWVVFRAETVHEQVGGTQDYGSEIWWSDGTEEGTKWLGFDFAKGETNGLPTATQFALPYAKGDILYFRANDGIHGVEPCIWDMSKPIVEGENPRQIFDVNHWSGNVQYDSWPSEFIEYSDHLLMQVNGGYFMPEDPSQYASGYSLWLTPLNQMDTCIYQRQFWGMEIAPGSLNDNFASPVKVREKLFFRAQDDNNNAELWMLNNINSAPVKVADLPENGNPSNFMNIENNLYFVGNSTPTPVIRSLFVYDLDEATGINNIKIDDTNAKIYVSQGVLHVDSESPVLSLQLVDLSGRIVKTSAGKGNTLNVSSLNGFFIVKVQFENNGQVARKIILK